MRLLLPLLDHFFTIFFNEVRKVNFENHLERTMSNSDINAWPKMADYPQTEDGWNQYANEWVSRRRRTTGLAQIPMAALEEHWVAMDLGREMGWEEYG